jgi:hypothetical protein
MWRFRSRSGPEVKLQGLSGEGYVEVTEKEKAEEGTPAFMVSSVVFGQL